MVSSLKDKMLERIVIFLNSVLIQWLFHTIMPNPRPPVQTKKQIYTFGYELILALVAIDEEKERRKIEDVIHLNLNFVMRMSVMIDFGIKTGETTRDQRSSNFLHYRLSKRYAQNITVTNLFKLSSVILSICICV